MSRVTLLCLTSAVVALSACDQQVDSHFQGDSLLRIRGNVVIPEDQAGADYVPAIVFEAVKPQNVQPCCDRTTYDHQRIVDVGVQGEFPSNFTLDVFDPPPADALQQMIPGEPAYAIGYVTAVPTDHPDAVTTLRFGAESENLTEQQMRFELFSAQCGEGDRSCAIEHTCTLDYESCLFRKLECPTGAPIRTNIDCEVVASEGDASLAVAGYSVNYRVLYFSAAVPADTLLAATWAAGNPIPAGYHLYRRVQLTSATVGPEPQPCREQAEANAIVDYNTEHGTSLTPSELSNRRDESSYDFDRAILRAMKELGCPLGGDHPHERIEEIERAPVSIDLGALDTWSIW